MLAQFSIYPTDATHMSRDIAQLLEILDQSGVDYQLGPMSTSIEGTWDQVMNAIRKCHEFMHNQHWRVITTITIDENMQQTHHLAEMVSVVEERLGHAGNSRAPRRTSQPVDEAC
jgi:uncharacterized protein (TIGR00106 family)